MGAEPFGPLSARLAERYRIERELGEGGMATVAGETLRARLAREGTVPIGEAVSILAEIADALACAHGQAIIHRDIKPENILFS